MKADRFFAIDRGNSCKFIAVGKCFLPMAVACTVKIQKTFSPVLLWIMVVVTTILMSPHVHAATYSTYTSISALKADAVAGKIKSTTKVLLDIDFCKQKQGSLNEWFVIDLDNPEDAIYVKNFSSECVSPIDADCYHGIYGVVTIFDDEFTIRVNIKPSDADDALLNAHVGIDRLPLYVLPLNVDAVTVRDANNINKIARASGTLKYDKTQSVYYLLLGDQNQLYVKFREAPASGYEGSNVTVVGGISSVLPDDCITGIYVDEIWMSGEEPARTLRVSAGEGGTVCIGQEGSGQTEIAVTDGSSVILHAQPMSGYVFDSWKVAGTLVSTDATAAVTAIADVTYEAVFIKLDRPEDVAISVACNDDQLGTATLAVEGSEESASASLRVLPGTAVVATAVPAVGAGFAGWYSGETCLSTDAQYRFEVSTDRQLEARFYKGATVTVENCTGGLLTVTANGNPLPESGFVQLGSVIRIDAVTSDGYELEEVCVNGEPIEIPAVFDLSENIIVTATFSIDPEYLPAATTIYELDAQRTDGRKVNITTPLTVVERLDGYDYLLTDGNSVIVIVSPKLVMTPDQVIKALNGVCKTIGGIPYVSLTEAPDVDLDGQPVKIEPETATVSMLPSMPGRYVRLHGVTIQSGEVRDYSNSRMGQAKYGFFCPDNLFYPEAGALYDVVGTVCASGIDPVVYTNSHPVMVDHSSSNIVGVSVRVDSPERGTAWIERSDNADNRYRTVEAAAQLVDVSLTAEAAEGWEFDHWIDKDGAVSEENPLTFNLDTTTNYCAVFKEKTTTEEPENPDPDKREKPDPEKPDPEQPENPENPDPEKPDPENPEKPDNPEQPVKPQKFVATFRQAAHGTFSVICGGSVLASGSYVEKDAVLTVNITADDGYHVAALMVNGTPVEVHSDATATITVAGDVEISVAYERDKPAYSELRVAVAPWEEDIPMGKVYIDTEGTSYITSVRGEQHVYHAEPAEGCRFVGWRQQGMESIMNTSSVFTVTASADITLVAEFDYIVQAARRVSVCASDEAKGSVAIAGIDGTEITTRRYLHISVTPASDDHRFVAWKDASGRIVSDKPEFVYTDAADAELTAIFSSSYFVKVTTAGNGNFTSGETVLADRQPEGSIVQLKFVPDDHHELVSVTVDGAAISFTPDEDGCFTLDLLVDAHHSVEAEYSPCRYKIAVIPHAHGKIEVYGGIDNDGRPVGSAFVDGSKVQYATRLHLFVTPDDGYRLINLSINGTAVILPEGGVAGDVYRYEFEIDGDVSLAADYQPVKTPTGIGEIGCDASGNPYTVYDLSGRYRGTTENVKTLPAGIYILVNTSTGESLKYHHNP